MLDTFDESVPVFSCVVRLQRVSEVLHFSWLMQIVSNRE